MPPKPFPGPLNGPGHLEWKAAQLVLNRKASARRARWATHIGHPFPKSADDHELPDPGTWELPDAELG